MTERSRPALIRVSSGDEGNHHISYIQRRRPHWEDPGNGYRYGPPAGSFYGGHTLFVEQWSDDTRNGLRIVHNGLGSIGSAGLILGSERNQVDVCMWGVSNGAPIESDLFDVNKLHIDEGEIIHKSEGIFDRRVVVPIYAGTLSIHLAIKEWDPTAF